jgi:hypothetical protein
MIKSRNRPTISTFLRMWRPATRLPANPLNLLSRIFPLPPIPRRITLQFMESLWWDGVFRGAVVASIAWAALILFALLVSLFVRWGKT